MSWDWQRVCRLWRGLAALAMSFGAVSTVWADFNLDGVVNENSGKPVAGALVSIVSVGPRAGKSAFSIWCHPDAGKHAITDAAGKFSLRGVDPIWIFTLAIEAKDHAPRELTADPRSTLPLRIRMLGENDLDTTGKVLLADGTPAAGAVVKIVSFETRGTHDLEDAFRATSVTTDEEGAFLIHSELLLSTIDVTVSYPDAVVNRVYRLAPSQKGQKLVLVPGTTLTGRVLTGARPAAGVPVRLTGLGGGTTLVEFAGNYDAVTDASGRFTFNHVYPLREFRLFTRMSEQGEVSGVAIPQTVLSGGTGKTLEVGELNLHPTHRVRGRVMLAGSGRHLPRMVVRLERLAAPDTREVEVDEKNSFSFEGVPAESVSLEFRSHGGSAVRGYRLAANNGSAVRGSALIGRVDEDVDLYVLFELGDVPLEPLRPAKLRDAAQLNAVYWMRQSHAAKRPLAGISAEWAERLLGDQP